jgi:hypothetical protein
MTDKKISGGATFPKRLMRKGSFVAEIKGEGDLFRFVIRDENHTAPSIHGSKKSLQESESEVKAVLDQLGLLDRAA